MIVAVDLERSSIELRNRDDFKALKVLVSGERDLGGVLGVLGGQTRGGEVEHVWIRASVIERWAEPASADWTRSFRAMLEAVRPFGWYDVESDEVRLHVEWT